MKIVGVTLNDDIINYYFVENLELKKNITIIVEDEGLLNFGKVATEIHNIDEEKLTKKLGKVVRIATKKDYNHHLNNIKKASSALKKCKELIKQQKLEMNVIDSYYTFNQEQLVFHFYSDSRIDFRNLARDLANIYKTRIELRQIGVRDKAKKICGIGICGQKLCCSRFLNEFDTVSISMAKNQNLSLAPSKINGVCGRLLCCLKYEDDCYTECKKNLPNVGTIIDTEKIKGKVISVDILQKKYTVSTEKGNIEIEIDGSN